MQIESLLEGSARRVPDKVALVCGSTRRTYAELDREADRLANAFVAMGVERGDRIAICLENGPEAVVSIFGGLKAGAVIVPVSPMTKVEKFDRLLEDSGARALVISDRKVDGIDSLPSAAILVVGDGNHASPRLGWNEVLSSHEPVRPAKRTAETDLACLLYTSGSTANPKGVMHTHRSLSTATRSIAEYLGSSAADVVLSVLPLSFGYGLTQLLPTFLVGGTLVLERSFAFPQVTLQRLAGEKCTGFAMVPTIATILLQNDLSKFDLSSLRYLTNAGAGIAPELLKELRRRLPRVRIFPMYGQTECIRVTFLPPEEVDRIPASVGKGMPNQEMWIVDERGLRLPPGKTGELVVRGDHVMKGYWKLEEATRERLRPGTAPGERVLHTGDLFRVDEDGWYYFVSRKDDIIKTRGEKVSPKEVENALYALDGVLAAAVVGIPDDLLGQTVKAFIVCNPDSKLDEKTVLRHCMGLLEDFAVPKSVEFLQEMPQTPNAKIDRRVLQERGGPA